MAITNFNTSNQTFRKLMGNGLVYRVPQFQRDYSWEEEQWDDLWQDILASQSPGRESAHYLGYLVLQTKDDRYYDIIDGQQRLTTLSLIVLTVLKRLNELADKGQEAENNRRRSEELRKTYIGYLDPVTLIAQSKLTLNRNNDRFYQTYLVPLAELPRRGLKASEQLLRKAFDWFSSRLAQNKAIQSGESLARFLDNLSDRLFFTVITVTDELNAFKVFETLNARGVRLSSTDLLKNYLFSIVHAAGSHPTEMNEVEAKWETITGKIGSDSLPDFLRVYWNSRHPLTRHSELFKTIRREVQNKAQTFHLLRELDRDADIYAAFGNPADDFWTDEQKKAIAELDLFGIRQPFSLLLIAYHTVDQETFTRLLKACVVISLRYNLIGGLSPGDQEGVYNRAAEQLADLQISNLPDLLQLLRPIYPSDEQFRNAFKEKQLRTTNTRNKRVARYLLFRIESHLTNHAWDFNSKQYDLEHILPESPQDGWESFTDEDVDRFVHRLGNLTILEHSRNRDLGNKAYTLKAEVYEQSAFGLTQRVAEENQDWNPGRIVARQNWLATQATAIWKVTGL